MNVMLFVMRAGLHQSLLTTSSATRPEKSPEVEGTGWSAFGSLGGPGQALRLRTFVHIHECSVGPELSRVA